MAKKNKKNKDKKKKADLGKHAVGNGTSASDEEVEPDALIDEASEPVEPASRGREAAKAHSSAQPVKAPAHATGNGTKDEAGQEQADSGHEEDSAHEEEAFQDDEAADASIPVISSEDVPEGYDPKQDPEYLEKKAAKRKKRLRTAGKVAGITGGVLVAVYVAGIIFFMSHFYPNTKIGSYDISLKAQPEAEAILSNGVSDYALSIKGQGLDFSIASKQTDIAFDSKEVVTKALADNATWQWPVAVFLQHDESDNLAATYTKSGVADLVKAKVDAFNAAATLPVSASIAYDTKAKSFQVVPEVFGTALDYNSVMRVVDNSIKTLSPTANITKDELVHPLIMSDHPNLKKACVAANKMVTADLVLMMNGLQVTELTPEKIATWVTLDDNINAAFNEAAFNAWIDEVAAGCNTVGAQRTYTRPDGKVITVSGGSYGWEIDSDALRTMIKDGVAAGTVGTIEIPVLQTGNGFAGIGGRDWGNRYVDIDLSEQHARFYDEAGTLIWESDIISGRPDGKHNTPTGVYVLNSKASPSKLIGERDASGKPEYETTVSYWMPFVGNAVGLHDATWQPGFGGSMYRNGYGSHGCVNLPYSAAQQLYGMIQTGDVVITHF